MAANTRIFGPNNTSEYTGNYYRVILALFGLGYLFSFYYRGSTAASLEEFLVPRNVFGFLALALSAATWLIPLIRKHIADIASGFFLVCTLHLIGFFATNQFISYYEIGLITVVLISNLHLNKVLYIVLYNVIVLTVMEYVFISAPAGSNVQPVLFFFFLLAVMVLCIFYQLYRIRFRDAQDARQALRDGIITGNPDAWMIFQGPGLVATDAGNKALELLEIADGSKLEDISLRALIAGESSEHTENFIRSVLTQPESEWRGMCRKPGGSLFPADVSCFRIPGQPGYYQCRFITLSDKPVPEQVPDELIRYRRYLDQVGSGFVVTDATGTIKLMNRTAQDLLQPGRPESLNGKMLSQAIGAEAAGQILKAFEPFLKGTQQQQASGPFTLSTPAFSLAANLHYDFLDGTREIVLVITPVPELPAVPERTETGIAPFPDPGNHICITVISKAGKIIRASEAFSRLTGYPVQALEGMEAIRLIRPADTSSWKSVTAGGGMAETGMFASDGRLIVARIFATATPETSQVIYLDVSDLRSAESMLRDTSARVRAIMENTNEVVYSVDFNHRIVEMNAAFLNEIKRRNPGHQPQAGDDIRKFMGTAEKSEWEQAYNAVMKGERIRRDESITDPEGKVSHFEVSYNPIVNGEGMVTGIAVWSRNVDQRIRYEAVLKRERDDADSATRAKSGFLATMSHEIRTPLNGLLGMSQLLAETRLSTEQRGYLETIRISGEALLSVINDILDFSRIESGKLVLNAVPFEPASVVTDTLEILGYKAREKSLALTYAVSPGVPAWVLGDAARVRQILVNLVSNAIKFTEQGEIRIDVTPWKHETGEPGISYSVRDTGIGMTREQLARIFDQFEQAEQSTYSRYGGSGLGLAISKRLAEMMQGELYAESTAGKGSVFHCNIGAPPVQAPANKGKIPPAAAALKLPRQVKILVVEDNTVNQELIRVFLEKLGYAPDLASDGFEALKKIESTLYDLVLLDIQMPGMDGFETARQIRSRFGAKPILVALTAMAMQGDREKCLEAGMQDYLPKPVSLDALRDAIARWTGPVADPKITDEPLSKNSGLVPVNPKVIANLRELAGDDPSFLKNLIGLYVDQSASIIRDIEQHVHSLNWIEVSKSAHKLKGSSLNLGVDQVAESCKTIEELVLNSETEKIPDALRMLRTQFELATRELQTIG